FEEPRSVPGLSAPGRPPAWIHVLPVIESGVTVVHEHPVPETTGAAVAAGAMPVIAGDTVATRNMTTASAPFRSQCAPAPPGPTGDTTLGGAPRDFDMNRPSPQRFRPIARMRAGPGR